MKLLKRSASESAIQSRCPVSAGWRDLYCRTDKPQFRWNHIFRQWMDAGSW